MPGARRFVAGRPPCWRHAEPLYSERSRESGSIMEIIAWIVRLAGLYLVVGILFAVPFSLKGAAAIDPTARGGSWGFKLLIIPGSMIFWPLLARRWMKGPAEPPPECNAHRAAARLREETAS